MDSTVLAQVPKGTGSKPAAASKTTSSPSELALLKVLRENPVTGPYSFQTSRKDGKLVLSGRVGTREIHDIAVRLALAITPSIDDRLVIDTAEAHRVAGVPLATPPSTLLAPGQYGYGNTGTTYFPGLSPLVYPPPLFGRLDEPFYGFEPPIISYPPWWGAVAARRADPAVTQALGANSPVDPNLDRGNPPPPPSPAQASQAGDTVEMTLDPRGVAVLRGSVPTMRDRIGVGQKVARMEGVTEVINLIEVREDANQPNTPRPGGDAPPPPPTPASDLQRPAPMAPAQNSPSPPAKPALATGTGDDAALARRLAQSLLRRPALVGLNIQSSVRDGVAYISGKVPTALEAMLAFRAAQQTVGIHEIVDRLEFAVPDGQSPNPLIAKGRPEDVEPYLEAQIRRQIGDKAHIDRVRVTGDRIELRGTVTSARDQPRIEAILRSMPLLRGFSLDATLLPE